MKKFLLPIAFLFILSACGASKMMKPTQADADRAKSTYPDMSLAKLTEAEGLYKANCGTCHGLKTAFSASPEKLKKVVPPMVQKANEKAGKQVLDANDQQLILEYLLTMTSK